MAIKAKRCCSRIFSLLLLHDGRGQCHCTVLDKIPSHTDAGAEGAGQQVSQASGRISKKDPKLCFRTGSQAQENKLLNTRLQASFR